MITDALLQLSSAQAVTSTAVSQNTIDLGARDVGPGTDLYAVINTDVSAVSGGATTVTFQVITSASADLSSPTIVASTGPIPKADLTAGSYPISIPVTQQALKANKLGQRYLGVRYEVAAGPLTAGAFTATITNSAPAGDKYYPSGFSVF